MQDADRDQWDRRERDNNRWAKFEQRLSALEGTQGRILEIVERLEGDSHDAVVRADERAKMRANRKAWIREFGSVIGYVGAAIGAALGLMALFGG